MDCKVSFEITYIKSPITTFEHAYCQNIKYLKLNTSQGSFIFAAGIGNLSTSKNIYNKSVNAFESMNQILVNEGISYSDVIRQWNYIEKIVDSTNNNQHYQIFNDVRSLYYDKDIFKFGYPAATGIGMELGGIIIDFIALKKNEQTSIIPIKSPVQTDTHQYSEVVLASIDLPISKIKTTPKFERAKVIANQDHAIMFISGTAAIKGEKSAEGISICLLKAFFTKVASALFFIYIL